MSQNVKNGGDRIACTKCDKDYATKASLKNHVTRAHTVTVTVSKETTKVTDVTDTQELDVENEVMEEAKEEQELYDSLDNLVKKIDDPEMAKESKEELLQKVLRL